MEKMIMINKAEILKDCPKGTKLYSPLCGECYFDRLNQGTIICKKQNTQEITFTSEGYYMLPVFDDCECVLFPSKENRDWTKFQRPFKDGDVLVHTQNNRVIISLVKGEEFKDKSIIIPYCALWDKGEGLAIDEPICFYADNTRFATEEEKQKLFDAIKANGYKWNAETKTLEKLLVPKFKVEDRIEKYGCRFSIKQITDSEYIFQCGDKIPIDRQNEFELVPNKFDITTLKPFDKVLVRDSNEQLWVADLFGFHDDRMVYKFMCVGHNVNQCIPYNSDTKHLLGATNDCDEYYKTW